MPQSVGPGAKVWPGHPKAFQSPPGTCRWPGLVTGNTADCGCGRAFKLHVFVPWSVLCCVYENRFKISPGFGCLEDGVPRSPAPRMTGSWVDSVWAAGPVHAGWVWRPWRLQLCQRLGWAGGASPGQACGNCRSRSDGVCSQQAWREAGMPPGGAATATRSGDLQGRRFVRCGFRR